MSGLCGYTEETTMSNTFVLTEEHEELIHRVFGGTKILRDTVRTVNTGGYVMNDLYDTPDGHLVVVYEYGAVFLNDPNDFLDYEVETVPQFEWDEPLELSFDIYVPGDNNG